MVYKRMVEIGRVVYIAKGDSEGKLAAIVDVVDGNRVSFISFFIRTRFTDIIDVRQKHLKFALKILVLKV